MAGADPNRTVVVGYMMTFDRTRDTEITDAVSNSRLVSAFVMSPLIQ